MGVRVTLGLLHVKEEYRPPAAATAEWTWLSDTPLGALVAGAVMTQTGRGRGTPAPRGLGEGKGLEVCGRLSVASASEYH